MDCKEVERLIPAYLKEELNEKRTKEFLEHMKECKSCYEEMEIQYMASTGLEWLESGSSIDLEHEMEKILTNSEKKLKQRRIIKIAGAIINAIAIVAIILTLLVQISIWVTGTTPKPAMFGIEVGQEK